MKKVQGSTIVNKKTLSVVGFWMTIIFFCDLLRLIDDDIQLLPTAVIWPVGIIGITLSIFSNFVKEKKPD
ncbi:hypothetical protein MKY30_10195 [Oceanobacillus sp. FSL W8-0428]|uniref:Uncharacterized protein n=1 Tax=Oceanobacillus sojae TaxID=582851 RepID=A0A511ZJY3_9BACI|nr:hypothetical protein [Oceanobacillus sojae]GEN87754.1 hypothetical protein OSO01_24930 [Oceanobacillus sojae]